jgi:hypothetical protein
LNAKVPAEAGVTDAEAGTEFPAPRVMVDVEVEVPVQDALVKNEYVTLPVTPVDGNPPVNVAWSVTEAPTVIVADGLIVAVIVGVVLFTVRG